MLMRSQHLYKSPGIEDYGPSRLLLPCLRVPCWFFPIQGWKIAGRGSRGLNPQAYRSLFSDRSLWLLHQLYFELTTLMPCNLLLFFNNFKVRLAKLCSWKTDCGWFYFSGCELHQTGIEPWPPGLKSSK